MFEPDSDDMIGVAAERWTKRSLAKTGLLLVLAFHLALALLLVL